MTLDRASISLVVITKNEEKHIRNCLQSASFVDEMIVVDCGSSDKTQAIVRELKARLILRNWKGFADQKQFALEQAGCDWILVLDADEILTPECRNEIETFLHSDVRDSTIHGFRIPRYHRFLGRLLVHGKGVDYPVRLVKKGKARYTDRWIHEEILVEGSVEKIKAGMIHNSSPTISDRFKKIERDKQMEVQHFQRTLGMPKTSIWSLYLNPIRYFVSYILRRGGWRDGVPGLIWTALFAFQMFSQEAQFRKVSAANEDHSRG